MHLLLTALGSYGDVLPIVGLASAMQRRGHRAQVISNPHFATLIERAGLEFLPLGTEDDYDQQARHPDLWNPVRGPIYVLRTTVNKFLRELYELIDTNCVVGETVLVAHCLDFASRVHQDKHGTAVASVHLAPICLRSFHQSPQMFSMLMQSWWPAWFRRAQFWLADCVLDRIVGPSLNALRCELELEPVGEVMKHWIFSPQLVLGLFPDWFAPPQPDWPSQTKTSGFPQWDPIDTAGMSTEVQQFLAAGSPPIVFAPGSAMTEGDSFFAAAAEACQQLGRRGILCTKYPEQLPRSLPEGVRSFGFVPFSQLLPHAAALVHHGGIGTCAQGLAAGLPQLVMPMAYDQLDNATRLKRLGVAATIHRKQFRGPKVAEGLQRLLADSAVQTQARDWAARMSPEQSLQIACESLEELLQK